MKDGDEECIIDNLSYSLNFSVSDRGLYFLSLNGAPTKTSVEFFDFATGKRNTLMKVGKPFWFGMGLSPDRSSLLFSVLDHAGSDLMMVDQFH